MSAGQIAVAAPGRTRIAFVTLAVIGAFILGSATGGLVALAASPSTSQSQVAAVNDPTGACVSAEFTDYRRLMGNMRAAADRHDIRAYVGFRNDLAALFGRVSTEGSLQVVRAIELGCWG